MIRACLVCLLACGDNRAVVTEDARASIAVDGAPDAPAVVADATIDAPIDGAIDAPRAIIPDPPTVEAIQDPGDINFPWLVVSSVPAATSLRVYADACSGPVLLELQGPDGGYQQITSPIPDNTSVRFCADLSNSAGTSACTCDTFVWSEDSSAPPNGGDIRCALDVDHASAAAVAADADGSLVVAGYFTGPATFGGGEASETTLGAAAGLFIARYRADCTLAWAREVIGPSPRSLRGDNFGVGLVAQPTGIAVAATFTGTAIFGPAEATQAILASSGNGAFVARYDRDGWFLDAHAIETAGLAQVSGLAATADALYVSGWLDTATATFGPGEPDQTSVAGAAMFVARFAATGTLDWVHATASTLGIAAYDVAAAPDGGALITGAFRGTATFESGVTRSSHTSGTTSDVDIFVARYLVDGSLAWIAQAGGYGHHEGHAIALAPDGASATITGSYGGPYTGGVGSVTFGAGEPNQTWLVATGTEVEAFVARYDVATGALVWARRTTDSQTSDSGQAIASTSDGGAIVAGLFGGPLSPGTAQFGPAGLELWSHGYDVFVARYTAAGDLAWVRQAGGEGGLDDIYGVAVSADDTTTVVGQFQRTALFDPANPFAIALTAVAGQIDGYVARFAP